MNPPYYKLYLTRTASAAGIYWQNGSDGTGIVIDGKWGYSATCPDDLFLLMLRLSAHLYRARSTGQAGAVTAVSKRAGLAVGQAEFPDDLLMELRYFKR
jgi:hypothetical protein